MNCVYRKFLVRLLICFLFAFQLASCGNSDEEKPLVEEAADGRLSLGILVNSQTELYEISEDTQYRITTPVQTARSSKDADILARAGFVQFPKNVIDRNSLYLLRVTGGSDVDVNSDLVMDAAETPFGGTLHALITGTQLLEGGWSVNVLTEIVYRQLSYELALGASRTSIVDGMEAVAQTLLASGDCLDPEQVNCSSYGNVLNWSPSESLHRKRLLRRLAIIDALTIQLRNGGVISPAGLQDTELPELATNAEEIETLNILSEQNSNSLLSFMASALELTSLEISAPVVQIQLAEIEDFNGSVLELAFVLDEKSLKVLDISSPANAVVLSVDNLLQTDAGAQDFVAMAYVGGQTSGNLYVLLDDNSLHWYRISNGVLGADLLNYEKRIAGVFTGVNAVAATDYLYLSNAANQLLIYEPNIDPGLDSPLVTSSFYDNLSINSSDTKAFFRGEAVSNEIKVGVLDISNPLSPTVLTEVTFPAGYPWGVTNGYVVGEEVVTVELKANYFVEGYIQRRSASDFNTVLDEVLLSNETGALAVFGSKAYLAGGSAIDIYDTSDLSYGGKLGAAGIPAAVSGNTLFTYLTGSDATQLKLYNLDGEFASTALLNSFDFGNAYYFVDFARNADRLYFTSFFPDGAKYFKTYHADLPDGTMSSATVNWQTQGDIHFKNNYAYFLSADAENWPIEDPTALEIRHVSDDLVNASPGITGKHLGITGNYLLVFNDSFYTAFTLSNPINPVDQGSTNVGGVVQMVKTVDDQVYSLIETATDTLLQHYDATSGSLIVTETALGIDPNDLTTRAVTAGSNYIYVLLDISGSDSVLAVDPATNEVNLLDFSEWLGPQQQITHIDGCYALSEVEDLSIVIVFDICSESKPQLLGSLRSVGDIVLKDGVLLIGSGGAYRSKYSLYQLPNVSAF